MSKQQKRRPNCTQVCTLAGTGGCGYTVQWGTPTSFHPEVPNFCVGTKTLGEQPGLMPMYFVLPTAYYRGGMAKS